MELALPGSRSKGRSRSDSSEDEDGLVHGVGVECWSRRRDKNCEIFYGMFPAGRLVQRKRNSHCECWRGIHGDLEDTRLAIFQV